MKARTVIMLSVLACGCSAPIERRSISADAGCELTVIVAPRETAYRDFVSEAYHGSAFVCPFSAEQDDTASVLIAPEFPDQCKASTFSGRRVVSRTTLTGPDFNSRQLACSPLANNRPSKDLRYFRWSLGSGDAIAIARDKLALRQGILDYVTKSGLPIRDLVATGSQICVSIDRSSKLSPRSALQQLGFSTDIDFSEEETPSLACEALRVPARAPGLR